MYSMTMKRGGSSLPFVTDGEVDDGLVRAGLVQELDGGAHRRAELLVAEVALLAEPHQQHAVGERAAHVVQQQRRAELPLHVAAADDLADVAVAGAVDELGGQRQLAVVEHADDDARAALLLGAPAFYGKFHDVPSGRPSFLLAVTGLGGDYLRAPAKKSKVFQPS
jgi:hypothetical protein